MLRILSIQLFLNNSAIFQYLSGGEYCRHFVEGNLGFLYLGLSAFLKFEIMWDAIIQISYILYIAYFMERILDNSFLIDIELVDDDYARDDSFQLLSYRSLMEDDISESTEERIWFTTEWNSSYLQSQLSFCTWCCLRTPQIVFWESKDP